MFSLSPCPCLHVSSCLLSNKVCLIFSVEILGRLREVPEEKQLVVRARITIVPSGSSAGDQILRLQAKASESE